MKSDVLMNMMDQFLRGDYDPWEFSFDFPDELSGSYASLEKERPGLGDLLHADMPEICADFEPDEVDRDCTYGLAEFKAKVREVYDAAAQLTDVHRQAI